MNESTQRCSTAENALIFRTAYISYHNYFAGSFVHCRKYFTVLINRCTKIFAKFIFVALNDYENILTTKISRFMVHLFLSFLWQS